MIGFLEGDESQVGIVILDMYGLYYVDLFDLILIYNFVIGFVLYFEKFLKSFMFGEVFSIQLVELLSCIIFVILVKWLIIFVGYGFQVEVVIFVRLGFNFVEDWILVIIDIGYFVR